MSSSIRIFCGRCGFVEIPASDASLTFTLHGDDFRAVLEYTCSGCGADTRRAVDERTTRLLAGAGVTVVTTAPAAVDSGHGTGL